MRAAFGSRAIYAGEKYALTRFWFAVGLRAIDGKQNRVFITWRNVSGDKHAAQLVRSLKQLDPQNDHRGHGGPEMAAAGAYIHRETVGNAAMGWRGALRAAEMYRLLRWTRKYFRRHQAALAIGVDSPSMNFTSPAPPTIAASPVLQYVAAAALGLAGMADQESPPLDRSPGVHSAVREGVFRRHNVNSLSSDIRCSMSCLQSRSSGIRPVLPAAPGDRFAGGIEKV